MSRRVTEACTFCRKRHLRCDGKSICYQCKYRGLECSYEGKLPSGQNGFENVKKEILEYNPVPLLRAKVIHDTMGISFFNYNESKAKSFWMAVVSQSYKEETNLLNLVNVCIYSGVISTGLRTIEGEKERSEYFYKVSLRLLIDILSIGDLEDPVCNNVQVLELITILSIYSLGCMNINEATSTITLAIPLIQMFPNYPSHLGIRIYSILMATSKDNARRNHWLKMANFTLHQEDTMFSRLFLLIFFPLNMFNIEDLFDFEIHEGIYISEETRQYYDVILTFLADTERYLLPSLPSTHFLYGKIIISGIYSFINFKLAMIPNSISYSIECIESAQDFPLCVITALPVLYSLISITKSGSEYYFDIGFNLLKPLIEQWPLLSDISDRILEFSKSKSEEPVQMQNVVNTLSIPEGIFNDDFYT